MGEQAIPVEGDMAAHRLLGERGNAILASLTPADRSLLEPRLQPVTLKFRQRLEIPKRRIRAVFFLESGLASVIVNRAAGSGRQAEAAMFGREGMSGLAVVLGVGRSPHETLMQVEGAGQCIATDDLRSAMARSASLAATLLRFAHVQSVQVAYSVLASAQGKVEERLARWLLMAHDRIAGDDLHLTHEFLSVMLGVRRAGVTTALHELETRALISTARGTVTVIDRCGLEEGANGLYGAPEAEFERLFGPMQ
jgi:CRP-like cAMP-binding protein